MSKWVRKISGLRASRKGQTTAEYAIIVALVAVSSIAVILIFGDQLRNLFFSEAARIGTGTDQTVKDVTSGQDSKTSGKINEF